MIAGVLAASACLLGQVDLRAREPAPTGVVVGVEAQGVLVAPSAAQNPSLLIGWDRVRRVGGVHAEEAGAFAEVADTAWRARTRLERGDAVAAEPMLESLFTEYADGTGPLSVVVCEGLLRCRLRRGAQIAAIDPWMALLEARVDADPTSPAWVGDDWASRAGLGPVVDESSWLVPALPPMWLDWPSLARVSGGPVAPAAPSEGRAASLAALYEHAARFEVGAAGELPQELDQHWGVQLVRDIVEARTGDGAARQRARDRLSRRIEQGTDAWVEAWCRAGIGRSLVIEDSEEARLRGVLELLHLPARFRREQAYLAGLALGESVVVLEGLGDSEAALTLARELSREYRGHPVFDWAPLASYLSDHEIAGAPAERGRALAGLGQGAR